MELCKCDICNKPIEYYTQLHPIRTKDKTYYICDDCYFKWIIRYKQAGLNRPVDNNAQLLEWEKEFTKVFLKFKEENGAVKLIFT